MSGALPELPEQGKKRLADEFRARIWPGRRWGWIGRQGWRIQVAHVCGWDAHGEVALLAGAPWYRARQDGVDTLVETARWIHAGTGCPVCAELGLNLSHLPLLVTVNGAVQVDERPDERPEAGGRRD